VLSFFWVEEQNHKINVKVNNDSLTSYNENSFPIGFYWILLMLAYEFAVALRGGKCIIKNPISIMVVNNF